MRVKPTMLSVPTGKARRTGSPYGIWCAEGEWTDKPSDDRTVRHFLAIIEEWVRAPLVYMRTRTREELELSLRRWTQVRNRRYKVLYLASHGFAGGISLASGDLSLEELADTLEGKCHGRAVYFGSCGTLRIPQSRIDDFLAQTGAAAVFGYTKTVDWIDSASMDMVQLSAIAERRRWSTIEKRIAFDHPGVVERLGFTMHYGR